MINRKVYEKAIFETIKRGSTVISKDIDEVFNKSIINETSSSAKEGLHKTLTSIKLSVEKGNPACPDTGWPIFYVKVGNECEIEDGFMGIEDATRDAVRKATKLGYLRSTMKHPITAHDQGDNVGMNIPDFTYKFVPGKNIEVTFVAKGGGSECFGGTRHRVIAYADGIAGIQKFVIECYIAATRAGAICPPSVLGIGIGGTANVAANIAKEAACLRTVGSAHPDPIIHKMETDLYKAINSLGIGTMGTGGDISVFAVNIEYAVTHIAGIAVATSSNCMVARRATVRIMDNNNVEFLDSPNWFGRE